MQKFIMQISKLIDNYDAGRAKLHGLNYEQGLIVEVLQLLDGSENAPGYKIMKVGSSDDIAGELALQLKEHFARKDAA